MIINVTIRLTSPFLGSSKPDASGVRQIIKSENNNPTLFIKRFCNLCKKYANELGYIDYKHNSINVPNYIKVSSQEEIYQKNIKDANGNVKEEKFKCYPVGTMMELECYIDSKKIETEKALKIIELIGKYDGISQFGIQKNFGRFDIILCQQENG